MKIRIFSFSIFLSFFLLQCHQKSPHILAIVGDRTLTVEDFWNRYSTTQNIGVSDNLLVRKAFLQKMIEEEMLIAEAFRRGFHRDALGQYEYEKIRIQELLNAYLEKDIFSRLKVEEDELKTLYQWLNTKIRVRHLYASSKKEADSLYSELMRGKPFEEMAKSVFKDPQLRETGGDLGYITLDEMDLAFEEVAFSIPVGKISPPIRTAQGYSILRVEDRVSLPLFTESAFQKRRPQLEAYYFFRKKKKMAQSHADSLRTRLDIRFNDEILHALFRLLQDRKMSFLPDEKTPLDRSFLKKELVRSTLGVWDIQQFQQYARFTSENQQRWIRNEENLKDFISGLCIRAYILKEAKRAGLDKTSSYREKVRMKQEAYLLERMEKTISEVHPIPEDTLLAYFEKEKARFVIPPRIRLCQLVLKDPVLADRIANLLREGKSFEELVSVYSIDRRSASRDGDIGYFTESELGPYGKRIFALRVGQWIGPLKTDAFYRFFKCSEKTHARVPGFEEVRSDIIQTLRPFWVRKAKEKFLDSLCTQIRVVWYPEKLKSIKNEGKK